VVRAYARRARHVESTAQREQFLGELVRRAT
jgi:hypothetical protein